MPGSRKFRRKLPKPNLLRSTSGSEELTLKCSKCNLCIKLRGSPRNLLLKITLLPTTCNALYRAFPRVRETTRERKKVDEKNTLLGLPVRVNQARKLCLLSTLDS